MEKGELLKKMRLYVLLTQAHCGKPLLEAAREVIEGGADVIQLREKEAGDRDVLRLATELRKMTERAGVGFIMNDRPDLARLVNADGVHLGQEDLPPAAARKVLRAGQVLGVSTHNIDQARKAIADGADYIGVGPIFATATRGYERGVGTEYLSEAADEVSVPLVAIGGITPDKVAEILQAAPRRHVAIAVCAAILKAPDIAAATRTFKEAIERATGA